jgi:hypothetical protein
VPADGKSVLIAHRDSMKSMLQMLTPRCEPFLSEGVGTGRFLAGFARCADEMKKAELE